MGIQVDQATWREREDQKDIRSISKPESRTNRPSYFNICPDTNLYLIGFSMVETLAANSDTYFEDCSSVLPFESCIATLNFSSSLIGGLYMGPGDFPPNGTGTLSNSPGTVTAPASGAVFTYTNAADNEIYTITAMGFKAGGASEATTTGTGGSTATGSAGAAATVSKKSDAGRRGVGMVGLGLGLGLCVSVFVV